LFKLIQTATRASGKVGTAIREAYTAGQVEIITGCAAAIEAAYPVAKGEDGKDSNRQVRNDYLRVVRMGLMRVGRELPEPRKLTIKKVEGVWTVVDEAAPAPTPETETSPDADGGDEAPEVGMTEEQQEALWKAVELVSKSLHIKAVRIAVADALKAELAKAAKA
jgi:hypothetical protein